MSEPKSKLSVGLVHYPVLNKFGDVVTSSVTTLDVHDIARICRTFGAGPLYIITPNKTQQRLVERVMKHWIEGFGAEYNPDRKEALTLLKVVDTIDDMIENLKVERGAENIRLIVTSAMDAPDAIGFDEARERIEKSESCILLFGTAHGLADPVMDRADMRLKPIEGAGEYNHLPVRSAVAIIIEKLTGYN